MAASDLTLVEARHIALEAQGFGAGRPLGPVGLDHLRDVLRRIGLLQLDFVNVLVPSHYLVPFSRLGPYPRSSLDELAYGRRELTEQWLHEASLVPVGWWPLLRHRMVSHRVRPWGFERYMAAHPDYVACVLDEVRRRGPLAADELRGPDGTSRRLAESWFGTVPRAVLEAHFGRGNLAVAARRRDFARLYELAERIVPPIHLSCRVDGDDARRRLLAAAGRAHGVATLGDLADYVRMPVAEARPRVAELVEAGDLRPIRVDGWRDAAFLHREARVGAAPDAAALLSPFDPLIWTRRRTARLFAFDYRFEIFVPADKRRWGTYVLPFLLGDRLVARIDAKADRAGRRLSVPAAYLEAHAAPAPVANALAVELACLAAWLGLETVAVGSRGNLARALRAAVRGRAR